MKDPCDRYSVTRNGRLLDSDPMKDDMDILVFDKASGKWVTFEGTMGQQADSIPVSGKEAAQFCKDGLLPEHVTKAIKNDTGYYPDPWDD